MPRCLDGIRIVRCAREQEPNPPIDCQTDRDLAILLVEKADAIDEARLFNSVIEFRLELMGGVTHG